MLVEVQAQGQGNGTCESNARRRLHGVHCGKPESGSRDTLRYSDLRVSEASQLSGGDVSGTDGADRPRRTHVSRVGFLDSHSAISFMQPLGALQWNACAMTEIDVAPWQCRSRRARLRLLSQSRQPSVR